MVTMLLIFLRNIEKDRNRIKILPIVSLFKANHGKNLNIPLRVLSNIYIIVIKMFICIVSFLLLTLTYYHKLTNISLSLFYCIHKHSSSTTLTVVLIFKGNAHQHHK